MNKAIILHLDKGDGQENDFRAKMNNIQCLYTVWNLKKIKGIDVIVHSVHHMGELFRNSCCGIKKLIEVGDDLKMPNGIQGIYFTRLYSLLHPYVQKYDEVIMFDNDFIIRDFNEFQRLIDIEIGNSSYGIGNKYINSQQMNCVCFGFLKINMNLLKDSMSNEALERVLVDYKDNGWKNYEECIFPEMIRRFGGTLEEFEFFVFDNYGINKKSNKAFVHYGWTKSLSYKIRHVFHAISDYDFLTWLNGIGLLDKFNQDVNEVLNDVIMRYDQQYK